MLSLIVFVHSDEVFSPPGCLWLKVSVVELHSPGRFFIHVQSPELVEALRAVTVELQKTNGGLLGTNYKPDTGEVCAVKYSLDQVMKENTEENLKKCSCENTT
jgi:hypothetical protein